MNEQEYANHLLSLLSTTPAVVPPINIDDSRRHNARRCMTVIACHRLSQAGVAPTKLHHSTFEWNGGLFMLRNSRIVDHHWSTTHDSLVEKLQEIVQENLLVYLLTYWNVENGILHAWAVPGKVAIDAFGRLPTHIRTGWKTVEVGAADHQLKNAPGAPSFAPYYMLIDLIDTERAKLQEAIKTDDNLKRASLEEDSAEGTLAADGDVGEPSDEPPLIFTEQTLEFLLELPNRIDDGPWHEQNKRRYHDVLRNPSQAIVEGLATRFIERLNPAVAGGKRHLSMLKKNDWGKGGYHDHFWFAFYDPASGNKTKSIQLFVSFLGARRVWNYGLSIGRERGPYLSRFIEMLAGSRHAIAEYVRTAPLDTIIRLDINEDSIDFSPAEFADRLIENGDGSFWTGGTLTQFEIIREYPLSELMEHVEAFVDEVGGFFTWAWPLFDAIRTGTWPTVIAPSPHVGTVVDEVDESAPQTLCELSEITAIPEIFLTELEEALWAKQQVILVGPPGTSKTFIARQFARYFVRQRPRQPQGSSDVLYMHANWAYEDFFEGLKPTSKDGSLTFEPRMGFFLEWIAGLTDYSPAARHVLVLDEINRCDTAAVLGELLQLLEYRGTTVRLLSGRDFVFPKNVFIIGTMNSADRSIGRLDMALRRRFLWLDLHPLPETLDRWLNRLGNNPLGFKADTLKRCNELLAEHGIPSEQQIGHALFMLQRIAESDESSPNLDIPLSEKQLRQIVRFSVLPYVRELLTIQLGRTDSDLLPQISEILLSCVDGQVAPPESSNA